MDLRTKLVFGLVTVSLGSLLALGALAYTSAERLLSLQSERHLSSLAEARAQRARSVLEGWEEAVGLIASRTQLRRSLQSWHDTQSSAEEERIAQILADAESSSSFLEGVAAYDRAGGLVAAAGADAVDDLTTGGAKTGPEGFTFHRPEGQGTHHVHYSAPLMLEGEALGTLRAVLSIEKLAEVAENMTGLGRTGETLIMTREADGRVRLLTPRRHPVTRPDAGAVVDSLGAVALRGVEGPITEDLTDYRGEPVWAATRRIDPPGLGIVVKFDEAEERAEIAVFRERLLGVGMSLSAFAILLGVLMGFAMSKPIKDLAGVADQIRQGDLRARANSDRRDELGLLAETFNEMGDELERRMTQLQEFKTFFDASRDLLCIAGTDGFYKRLNPAFERTLGWSEESLLAKPFLDFVHPDDVEASAREVERLSQGFPTISFQNRIRCHDGSYKRLQWTCHPDPETGFLYASARVLPASGASPTDQEA